MESTFALFGIVIAITSLSLLSALAGWYYCLITYREELSDRAFAALKYALPPFVLLSASPLFDVVIWQATGEFPVVGVPGVALGLGGVAVVLGYVLYDYRWAETTTGRSVGAGTH